MTSTRLDPALRPVQTYDPAITPYRQGRNDRLAGKPLAESPYEDMANQQRWQEGWLAQDEIEYERKVRSL
jgi:ribosome modulation factor